MSFHAGGAGADDTNHQEPAHERANARFTVVHLDSTAAYQLRGEER